MSEEIKHDRRSFLLAGALSIAAASLGLMGAVMDQATSAEVQLPIEGDLPSRASFLARSRVFFSGISTSSDLMMFEELNSTLMVLSGLPGFERSEIPALARFLVSLSVRAEQWASLDSYKRATPGTQELASIDPTPKQLRTLLQISVDCHPA